MSRARYFLLIPLGLLMAATPFLILAIASREMAWGWFQLSLIFLLGYLVYGFISTGAFTRLAAYAGKTNHPRLTLSALYVSTTAAIILTIVLWYPIIVAALGGLLSGSGAPSDY